MLVNTYVVWWGLGRDFRRMWGLVRIRSVRLSGRAEIPEDGLPAAPETSYLKPNITTANPLENPNTKSSVYMSTTSHALLMKTNPDTKNEPIYPVDNSI